MKIPVPPPPVSELLAEDPASMGQIVIRAATDPTLTSTARYLAWDSLRHRKPPQGLTHRQWWLALKTARITARRPLRLVGADGVPFSYVLPDQVLRRLDEITRRASGQIAMPEVITNPATRDRYVVSSLIEEAITSSQMEGAVTTRRVAKEMIRSGRPPRDVSERMIVNNYAAMRHIGPLRHERLTPDLVCEIHRIVTEGTLADPEQAGRIQRDQATRVSVYGDGEQVLHLPPPVDQLPGRLEALCAFANGEDDESYVPPVLRALTIHFMAGYDHYFEDGNGRTARALFYWSMLHEGYWLTEFLSISKILKNAPAKYARSFIYTEQDDNDLTYFHIYQLDVLSRAIDELDTYLMRKVREIQNARELLASPSRNFNNRQLAVLDLAMRDDSTLFTVQSHAMSHRVSPETARQDLSDLARHGLLVRGKVGKKFTWQASSDLVDTARHH